MPYAETQGIRLYYDEQGTGVPPLVFIHGFACDHNDWQPQVDFFQTTHQVITCDLPGHGTSDQHPDHCSIESFGADVAALLTTLDLPPAVLVGHSMGCRVILQAYLDAPSRVAGLILVDGSCVGEDDPRIAMEKTQQHIANLGFSTMAQGLFADMFLEHSDPALKQRIIERALKLPDTVGAPLFTRLVGWDAGKMNSTLSQVAVPLCAIQSTYFNADRVRVSLQPEEATPWTDQVRHHIPSAQIEILSDLGHFPMLEAADLVNQKMATFLVQAGITL